MAKKQFFLIVDTETTSEDTVADFGAVIVDRKGEIFAQCAVLVAGEFDAKDLFYLPNSNGGWSKAASVKKREFYNSLLASGSRMLANVSAINRWLDKAIGKFAPTLTAYNLAFDADKCAKTGIDLTGFSQRFCLWQAAVGNICGSKAYREFALQNHRFNAPTEKGNMTYQTNAETVFGFLNGSIIEEPHTAIEDAVNFELPILTHILKRKKWQDRIVAYDWKAHQVKDNYTAKGLQ
jgi:hypothetical protein